MRSREVHLVERPQGLPTPAQFRVVETDVPDPGDGQVLVENIYMSVDPAMRPRLAGPTALNEAMIGGTIGRVIKSRHAGFKEGDHVESMHGFREHYLSDGKGLTTLDADGMPLIAYMSVLGLTGLTAYGGLLIIGALKDGENVFVSAAAGAVGSAVVQIAKIIGMRVIASAGAPDKCALVRELGADVVIDYKAEGSLADKLNAAAPDGIDVYFDNVGGAHLDAALGAAKDHARFAMCGMIETYNAPHPAALANIMRIVRARIKMQGFIIFDYNHRIGEFHAQMGKWMMDGLIRSDEIGRAHV